MLPTLDKKMEDNLHREMPHRWSMRNDLSEVSHRSQNMTRRIGARRRCRMLDHATLGGQQMIENKYQESSASRKRSIQINLNNQNEPVCSETQRISAKLPGKRNNQELGIIKLFLCNDEPSTLVCVSMMMIIIILANFTLVAEAVDCFKCSSRNGSNPACEDPFHNLNTTRITSPVLPDPPPNVIYHTPCYAGKKGREGLFPASACIKLTGTFDATGETLVVRHCALDSGTLTQDTELARMSHCGKFNFDGDSLKGCVLACPEDACNSAPPATINQGASQVAALALLLAVSTLLLVQSDITIYGPAKV